MASAVGVGTFVSYLSLKWGLFYLYHVVSAYGWQGPAWNAQTNMEGMVLALFMLLGWPLVEGLLLYWPVTRALQRRGGRTIFLLAVTFALEFLLGWYLTNQQWEEWMLVKLSGSVLAFLFLYRRQLFNSHRDKPFQTP